MDDDNSAPLFHHYIIPRGLGVSLKGNTSMKTLYGENINTDLFKLKGKNRFAEKGKTTNLGFTLHADTHGVPQNAGVTISIKRLYMPKACFRRCGCSDFYGLKNGYAENIGSDRLG